MPTAHRRVALVRDPELDAAIDRARDALGGDLAAATLVRELALRGAGTLPSDPAAEAVRELVEAHGARPAARPLARFLSERGPLGPPDPGRRASAFLDELRGE